MTQSEIVHISSYEGKYTLHITNLYRVVMHNGVAIRDNLPFEAQNTLNPE